ncbi:Uu.00g035360.m01.CDS01 [Anthostomella pinea]|uniref:Uu.00g035360.m01.CDS01 n=1 Tax=Anthostomella pinea TaxID=933095 RepID=A0AAI8V9B7_9PEZI|nr:Uu.00g035360.m01.CDS01 [Anthostomella pinea]
MISSVLMLIGAVAAWVLYRTASGLYTNIALAKASGLRYFVVPVNPITPIAQLTAPVWIAIWKLVVPKKYWEDVVDVCSPDWQHKKLHAPFEKMGETFVIATPSRMMMYTDSAEVIHQMTSRREAFPKPTETYGILTMFGENVVTTEGTIWRMHRKVTSASFNERNSAMVFKVAIEQAQGMVDYWIRRDTTQKIKSMEEDTMTLALNIIGYVGFGLRMLWPGQTLPGDADPKMSKYVSLDVPAGHTISFKESIARTLKYLLVLLMTPTLIIDYLPIKILKLSREARDNYTQYMKEFLRDKAEDVRQGDKEVGMDIMGSLVATSYQDEQSKTKVGKGAHLKDSEIIGNAFIMFLAGHETSANVIHFTLLELANNPAAQRRLQKDVDTILGGTDPSTWDYDQSVNAMMASTIGAAMNETLRVMPPVVEVPKKVSPTYDQTVTINDQKHTLPRNMYIGMIVSSVHRNPRFWPGKPSKIRDCPHDLDDWVPDRWFRPSFNDVTSVEGADTEDFGGYAGPDTSASMFHPVRGSYIPFSDGARSCLGRRIAQVEIIAALAVIFQKYSIENAVDDWASDEEIARMSRQEKADLYQRATRRSRQTLREASSLITLKLKGDAHVPVRLVRRGEERFVDWVE